MSKEESSYRQIMKATSIFGGVQVFNIIIQLIKSKIVAVLLGPTGIGIMGLLTSTIGMITAFTNFGIGTSAVKFISTAYAANNPNKVAIAVKVFRRLVWITGIFGGLVMLLLSAWLSDITFGNKDYTVAFSVLAVTLLINQISTGQNVILQGTRNLKYLAKSTMIGSLAGLFTTVPLYYLFGLQGIVPGIMITSFTTLLLSWYFARKVQIKKVFVSTLRTIVEGKSILKTGIALSLSGIITMAVSYYMRIHISNIGGVSEVGFYNAGFTIINTYVGLIFTAMIADYYPRLSIVAHDNNDSRTTVNHQAEITILILAPIILIFLVFIKWIVVILYSNKFLLINDMIQIAAMGMFFKAASWAIAFIFIAKGDNKVYFWNELLTNLYSLVLNIIGYKFFGLTGLGISFLITYLLYLIQVYIIAKVKYNFYFGRKFITIFAVQVLLAIICYLNVKFVVSPFQYLAGATLIGFSGYYSFYELDRRLNIRSLISNIIKKK